MGDVDKSAGGYSFLKGSEGKKDMRWAIEEVMSKSKSDMKKAGMWDFDKGKFKPVSSHFLSFDSDQNQLEPTYYWLLDWLGEKNWDLQKIVDNFMASPGSAQFSEMNIKASTMQDRGVKLSGDMNQIIKSVLNLLYDLKEFELRLETYDDYNSDDKKKRENGILGLKQIYLDNVDMKKQNGSIHQMTAQLGYSTLRDAFFMADGPEGAKKMNDEDEKNGGGGLINDSVMRVLIPRLADFEKWVVRSEKELRKRFSIERNYLKSQIETIKLYSAWMKPYLVSAAKLSQKGFDNHSALVNAFSTTMFELQLFGKQEVSQDEVYGGNYKAKRKYNRVMIIDLTFRGHAGQRVTQKGDYGFAYGGKFDITFDSYALNDEELLSAKKLLDDASVAESLQFSGDVAAEALADLKEDLDYFLMSDEDKEKVEEKDKKDKKEVYDINPFSALLGLGGKKKKSDKKDKKEEILAPEDIAKDNFVEELMRVQAAISAADWLYLGYDVYKKAHRMASAPDDGFDHFNEE